MHSATHALVGMGATAASERMSYRILAIPRAASMWFRISLLLIGGIPGSTDPPQSSMRHDICRFSAPLQHRTKRSPSSIALSLYVHVVPHFPTLSLSGTIPVQLGQLRLLQELNLHQNKLSGVYLCDTIRRVFLELCSPNLLPSKVGFDRVSGLWTATVPCLVIYGDESSISCRPIIYCGCK